MASVRYLRYSVTRWLNAGSAGTSGYTRVGSMQYVAADSSIWPLVPLTSDTTPSPYAATSSGALSTYDPFRAFDGVTGDAGRWLSVGDNNPAWLTIDMGSVQDFRTLLIAPDDNVTTSGGYLPLDFRVYGSTTGAFTGEESILLDVTNQNTGWANSTPRDYPLALFSQGAGITLPMLTAAAYTPQHGSLEIQLPLLSMSVFRGVVAALGMPALVLSARGGGQQSATLPSLKMYAKAVTIDPTGVVATLPALSASSSSGGGAAVQLPAARAQGSGTFIALGEYAFSLPAVVASGVASFGVAGEIALTLSSLSASGRNGGNAAMTLAAAAAAAGVKSGGVASVDVDLPMVRAGGAARRGDTATVEITLPALRSVNSGRIVVAIPSLWVGATGYAVVAYTYEAYAINLSKFRDGQPYEVTHYSNFPFTKIVRYKGDYYGVAADGLYLLGGDTDAGQPIASEWETHLADFGALQQKTPESMYISGRIGPTATGKVVDGEKASYTYPHLNPRGDFAQAHRIKLGKGIKSNYLGFGLADPAGGVMDVDLMDDRIPVLTRAI